MKRIITLSLCLLLFLGMFAFSAQAFSASPEAFSISLPHFNGLTEYEQFLEESTMPLNYVHASRFSPLGDFRSGTIYSATHQSYVYHYNSGYRVAISHYQKELISTAKQLDTLPYDAISMKHLSIRVDSDYFYYFRNGLYYIYHGRSGRLYRLEWFANWIHFAIYIDTSTPLCPVPVIDRLMSVSDAIATDAFDELCDSVGLSPNKMHFTERNALIDGIVTFLYIAVGVLSVILIHWSEKKWRARSIRFPRPCTNAPDTGWQVPLSAYANHESPFDTPNAH